MEFASAITGFIELCSWRSRADNDARQSRFHCMSPVVASRSFLGMPSASTVDPPPGSGSLPFRIWRVENCLRQEWPATPDRSCLRKTFQSRQNSASCPKFPKSFENCCEQNDGQRFCMTKQKTAQVWQRSADSMANCPARFPLVTPRSSPTSRRGSARRYADAFGI